jgi:hypothetical protein
MEFIERELDGAMDGIKAAKRLSKDSAKMVNKISVVMSTLAKAVMYAATKDGNVVLDKQVKDIKRVAADLANSSRMIK